nr:exosortase/archaeosortase family protein [Jiangella mangrovi]
MTAEPVFVIQRVVGDDTTWFAFTLTPQCSALYFLIPLTFIGAFVLASGRSTVTTLLVGIVAAGALLELINLVRIEALVFALLQGGSSMFGWVHDTVGSAAMAAGFAVALIVFFKLGFFGRRDRRRRAPVSGARHVRH